MPNITDGAFTTVLSLLAAVRNVYDADIDDGLMLRALTYFDDADREAPLPGEGPSDWKAVKGYFLVQGEAC